MPKMKVLDNRFDHAKAFHYQKQTTLLAFCPWKLQQLFLIVFELNNIENIEKARSNADFTNICF